MTSRRAFLFGATAALAAPSIVRAESLMKLWVPKPILQPALAWVPCDGRVLDRTVYAELFKIIGTIYGAPDGKTFNAPSRLSYAHEVSPLQGSIGIEYVVRAMPDQMTPVGVVLARMTQPFPHHPLVIG